MECIEMSVPSDKRAGVAEILTYIPFFEEVEEDQISRVVTEELAEDGTMPVETLMYRSPLLGFVEDAYVANILEPKYLEIINDQAMGEIELEVLVYGINQADYMLTMAVLTCIIVQEKVAPGIWGMATKEGWFLKILNHLQDLYDED